MYSSLFTFQITGCGGGDWLRVNLGSMVPIRAYSILNRQDSFVWGRLNGAKIELLDQNMNVVDVSNPVPIQSQQQNIITRIITQTLINNECMK